MSIAPALARATADPRSFLTSGWGRFVPSATLSAIAAQGRARPGPAEALVASCAARGCATSPVRRGPTTPQSRAPGPTSAIQIP